MIKLSFELGREYFFIIVENRQIWWKDRKLWSNGVRIVPIDEELDYKLSRLRNRKRAMEIRSFLTLTPEEIKQYNDTQTDEEIAEIVISDALRRGAKLIKREKE